MRIIRLTRENIADYSSHTGQDMAENIGRKYYQGLIAENEREFRGGIIWKYKNGEDDRESDIEWFTVAGRDAAEALFAAYRENMAEENVKRSVITISALESKEEKDILKEAGFNVRITESDQILVTLSELSAMPLMRSRKIPNRIRSISELTVRQFKKGIWRCVSAGKRGVCDDLEFLPIADFEREVSACCLDEDGEVSAFLLFHKHPSGVLSLQLMICLESDIGTVLPGMMRFFVCRMEQNYPPETKILLNRHNEASMLLSEKLLPRGFGIPVYTGSRTERN